MCKDLKPCILGIHGKINAYRQTASLLVGFPKTKQPIWEDLKRHVPIQAGSWRVPAWGVPSPGQIAWEGAKSLFASHPRFFAAACFALGEEAAAPVKSLVVAWVGALDQGVEEGIAGLPSGATTTALESLHEHA